MKPATLKKIGLVLMVGLALSPAANAGFFASAELGRNDSNHAASTREPANYSTTYAVNPTAPLSDDGDGHYLALGWHWKESGLYVEAARISLGNEWRTSSWFGSDGTLSTTKTSHTSREDDATALSVGKRFPLSRYFSLFGQVGLHRYTTEESASSVVANSRRLPSGQVEIIDQTVTTTGRSHTDRGVLYSVGLLFDTTHAYTFTLRATRLQGLDRRLLSFGLGISF